MQIYTAYAVFLYKEFYSLYRVIDLFYHIHIWDLNNIAIKIKTFDKKSSGSILDPFYCAFGD